MFPFNDKLKSEVNDSFYNFQNKNIVQTYSVQLIRERQLSVPKHIFLRTSYELEFYMNSIFFPNSGICHRCISMKNYVRERHHWPLDGFIQ